MLTVEGVQKLQVVMDTREFGKMHSKLIDAVEDQQINLRLLDTLGEDLITEYERRLAERPVVVQGWR